MSSLSFLLFRVHDRVHDFTIKLNYSEPKFYTGGIDISNWKNLSTKQKKEALAKRWYMYYSFRNPETGKLVRQPNIKAGVNTLKNFQDRIKELKNLKKALVLILDRGYNPFKEDTFEIIENRLNNSIAKKQPTPQPKEPKEPKQKVGYTIIEAKEIVLITKKKVLSH